MTGLLVGVTCVWSTGTTRAALTQKAFRPVYGDAGSIFVAIALVLFAFTIILSWNFYSRRNLLDRAQQAVKSGDSFKKLYPVVSFGG